MLSEKELLRFSETSESRIVTTLISCCCWPFLSVIETNNASPTPISFVNRVPYPVTTVPEEVIFHVPVTIFGVEAAGVGSSSPFIEDRDNSCFVTVVLVEDEADTAEVVFPSPIESVQWTSGVVLGVCLDFEFFFFVLLSPLKRSAPRPILILALVILSLSISFGLGVQVDGMYSYKRVLQSIVAVKTHLASQRRLGFVPIGRESNLQVLRDHVLFFSQDWKKRNLCKLKITFLTTVSQIFRQCLPAQNFR